MQPAQQRAYDKTRDFSRVGFQSACYAPFTSMYLDPRGDVRACCQNVEHVLGNVARARLTDIWWGSSADALRDALRDYDLGLGCRFCQWQVDDGNYRGVFAKDFDWLPLASPAPTWPQRLEFAVSNTCNLECVMCDGELSSMIRSRREHLPPLPKVYDTAFFSDLESFLPHLSEARFLGGEPFLAAESFRIWGLMADADLHTPCRVTTNGTQWNPRIEGVLERFPTAIAVSIDGATRRTFESIRVRADHAKVMDNFARFRAYTLERGTDLEISFCLMTRNWHEFGDLLLFGDAWDARVNLNTVTHRRYGLYQLPVDEFARVLDGLERRDKEMSSCLGLNRQVWDGELDRLRNWLATASAAGPRGPDRYFRRDEGQGTVGPQAAVSVMGAPPEPSVAPVPVILRQRDKTADAALSPPEAAVRVAADLTDPELSTLRCDPNDLVLAVDGAGGFVGLPAESCVGRPFAEVVEQLTKKWGRPVPVLEDRLPGGGVFRRVVFDKPGGDFRYLQVLSLPEWSGDELTGSVTLAACSTVSPFWAPTPT